MTGLFLLLIAHLGILVYGVLFMDWGEMAGREVKPFEGVDHIPCVDYLVYDYADMDKDSGMGSQTIQLDLDSKFDDVSNPCS